MQPARPTGTTKGTTALKVGSYNVTSAPAGAAKNKPWTKRKATIASTIVASGASVVGLQELSPNTVDVNEGTVRQTESLLAAVRSAAAKAGSSADYRMVRLSPYLRPGTTSGSQGQRILYDAKRLTLVSPCSDYTTETNAAGKPVEKFWSSTCFAELASNASESDIHKRGFAYAKFRDRKSGGEFWFVSVHLDPRDGVESLRGRQAQSVVSTMKRLNTRGLPVLVTGDLNSYQNKAEGNAPHDVFVGAGYTDSYIAKSRTNAQYATVNHWDTTVSTNTHGFGIRLDYVLGLGSATSRATSTWSSRRTARAARTTTWSTRRRTCRRSPDLIRARGPEASASGPRRVWRVAHAGVLDARPGPPRPASTGSARAWAP